MRNPWAGLIACCVIACCVIACDDTQQEPDTQEPEPDLPDLPHVDLELDAFPLDITHDGHLIYRSWTGQGLQLIALAIDSNERTVLDTIEPETIVIVDGSVVFWWEGPNGTLAYWSKPSGVREGVIDGSFSRLAGSKDGSHALFMGFTAQSTASFVFAPTTAAETAPFAAVKIQPGAAWHAEITEDNQLVMIGTTLADETELHRVHNGVHTAVPLPGGQHLVIDASGTLAVVEGERGYVVDLRNGEIVDIGESVAFAHFSGSSIVYVSSENGRHLVRFTLEDRKRRVMFPELGNLVIEETTYDRHPIGYQLMLRQGSRQDNRAWVLELRGETLSELSGTTPIGFTESGASLLVTEDPGNPTSMYRERVPLQAWSKDIGERTVLTDAVINCCWYSYDAQIVGEHVVIRRQQDGVPAEELWYANTISAQSARIATNVSGAGAPPPRWLRTRTQAFGRRIFYTAWLDDHAMMRSSVLP